MTPGRIFYQVASQPFSNLRAALQRGDLRGAMTAAHREQIIFAFQSAVARVAEESDLEPHRIHGLLPITMLEEAAGPAADSFAAVAAIWEQHAGGLAELLGIAAEVFDVFDGRGLDHLAKRANASILDIRTSRPLAQLEAAVRHYSAALAQCETLLDGTPFLREAYRSSRRRRAARKILFASIVVAGLSIGGAWLYPQLAPPASNDAVSAPLPTVVPPPVDPAPPPSASAKPTAAPASALGPRHDPRARAKCLSACVAKCADDTSCERSCAHGCPSD